MNRFRLLTKRNIQLFFRDKGLFFTSLITPIILLILYVTFLANVYRSSFVSVLPGGLSIPDKLIDGFVGGELFSSLLAVCCVTVSFCCNMLMVQDKITGARNDFTVAPVKNSLLSLSYYTATLISTLIVCFVATGVCFLYLAKVGWYLSAKDVGLILLDVFLLVMFGTALSSVVNAFLSTQGQISAVGTMVSAGYGFICGAYMPISSFGTGLQRIISFLPGTYGTALIRNHALTGVFREMQACGLPDAAAEALKDGFDCNLYFFEQRVSLGTMYLVLAAAIVVFILLYVLCCKALSAKAK